jgi:WD40 repeat protein
VVLQGHTGWVTSVAFSPCGRWLASASEDATVRVYRSELAAGDEPAVEAVLHGHTDTVRALRFSPCGRFLVSGSHDKTARVWDTRTWSEVRSAQHPSSVYAVVVAPDCRWLATGSYDRTARVLDAGGAGEIGVMRGHTGYVHDVDVSPDGRFLATASFDSTVRVWDVFSDQGAAAAVDMFSEAGLPIPGLVDLCASYC